MYREQGRKKVKNLEFGDVITIFAPFEENTPDFYNGYNVLDVRDDYIRDQYGRTGKWRPVMFIGESAGQLSYAPITSSTGANHDDQYQYIVNDTSMLPNQDTTFTSYVETNRVRVIPTESWYKYQYHGRLSEADIENIKDDMTRNATKLVSTFDKRTYIRSELKDKIVERLTSMQFEFHDGNPQIYSKEDKEVYLYSDNTILYHNVLSLETIRGFYHKNEKDFEDSLKELNERDNELQ